MTYDGIHDNGARIVIGSPRIRPQQMRVWIITFAGDREPLMNDDEFLNFWFMRPPNDLSGWTVEATIVNVRQPETGPDQGAG